MNGQQLKNSILQLAIQGRLVPQDSNDEPASALLSLIREEKKKLVEEKKIKKDKPLAPIKDEEKPFEIPESWEWVRLGDIANYGDVKKKKKVRDFSLHISACYAVQHVVLVKSLPISPIPNSQESQKAVPRPL